MDFVVPFLCRMTVLPVELWENFLNELAIMTAPFVNARGSLSVRVRLIFMLVVPYVLSMVLC